MVLLALAACGQTVDPSVATNEQETEIAVTLGSEDPPSLEERVRMWWERITDTSGIVTGRITYADGTPVALTTYECVPDVRRPRPDVAIVTNEDGSYTCRGAPGMYTLKMFARAKSGFIVEERIELKARTTIFLDVTAADPIPDPTPTWTKPG